jgi:hypothetical protein
MVDKDEEEIDKNHPGYRVNEDLDVDDPDTPLTPIPQPAAPKKIKVRLPLKKADFDESKHPRGHEGNPGQFAPKGGGGAAVAEKPKEARGAGPAGARFKMKRFYAAPKAADPAPAAPAKDEPAPKQEAVDPPAHPEPEEHWSRADGRKWTHDDFNALQDAYKGGLKWESDGSDQVARIAGGYEFRAERFGGRFFSMRALHNGKVLEDNVAVDDLDQGAGAILDRARRRITGENNDKVVSTGTFVPPDKSVFSKPAATPQRSRADQHHVEDVIHHDDFSQIEPIGEGDHANPAYVGDIKGDGKAVVKPENTAEKGQYGTPGHEVMAYEFSQACGFSVVPTTVYRQWGDGRKASAQEWAGNCILGVDFFSEDQVTDENTRDSISQMFVMDCISANKDRHLGNWMYNKDTHRIVAIDNGFSFLTSKAAATNLPDDNDRNEYILLNTLQKYYRNAQRWGYESDWNGDLKSQGFNLPIKEAHVDAAEKFVNSPAFDDMVKQHIGEDQLRFAKSRALYGIQFLRNKVLPQVRG